MQCLHNRTCWNVVEIFVGCRRKWSSENFAVAFGLAQWHVCFHLYRKLLTYLLILIHVFYPTGCTGHGSVNGDHRYILLGGIVIYTRFLMVASCPPVPGIHFERVSVGRLLVTRRASDMIGCAKRAGRSVPTSSCICSPTAASRGELDSFSASLETADLDLTQCDQTIDGHDAHRSRDRFPTNVSTRLHCAKTSLHVASMATCSRWFLCEMNSAFIAGLRNNFTTVSVVACNGVYT